MTIRSGSRGGGGGGRGDGANQYIPPPALRGPGATPRSDCLLRRSLSYKTLTQGPMARPIHQRRVRSASGRARGPPSTAPTREGNHCQARASPGKAGRAVQREVGVGKTKVSWLSRRRLWSRNSCAVTSRDGTSEMFALDGTHSCHNSNPRSATSR